MKEPTCNIFKKYYSIYRMNIVKIWEKGAFHIFFGSFLTKFVVFFGSIFLVRILNKSDYGLLSYVENLYGYFFIFAGYGLANALLRYIILGDTFEKKYSYFYYTTSKSFLFNFCLILIVFLFTRFFIFPIEFSKAKFLLSLIAISIPFHYLSTSSSLAFRAMMDNKYYAILTFLSSSFIILFKYLGAKFNGVEGAIIGKIVVNFIFGIFITILFYIKYFKGVSLYKLGKDEKKEIDQFSFQYMITSGIWIIFMLNDIFLLGYFTGNPNIVAEYKVAYVLPANLSLISTSIGIFIAPFFVKHEKDNNWVWKNFLKTLFVNNLIIIPIVLILLLFTRPIIKIFFGLNYINIVPIVRLLSISSFINSGFRYIVAHLLSSMGKINSTMFISIFGVIVQIFLNIILLPKFGVIGICITSIIVYSLMAIFLFAFFIKTYKPSKIIKKS